MPGRAGQSYGKALDRALSDERRSQIMVRREKGEHFLGCLCQPSTVRSSDFPSWQTFSSATHISPRGRSVDHADALSVDIQSGVGRHTGAFWGKRCQDGVDGIFANLVSRFRFGFVTRVRA
jgi:hypothetical protein